MSVTYGFYNSLNGDRKYDAVQMSSLFDGLILDGIFASIGTAFAVRAGSGNTVNVGVGKAWFNRTWTYNDSILPLTAPDSDLLKDRIDAIVIHVDSTDAVRKNEIKFITGDPGDDPSRPTLMRSERVNQYALCYINRAKSSTEIKDGDITNVIGTSETPFITGLIQTINIDELLGKWEGQLDDFVEDKTAELKTWKSQTDAYIADWIEQTNKDLASEKQLIDEWIASEENDFVAWFNRIKGQLSEDAAGNLQVQLDKEEIDRILLTGFVDGIKEFSEDGLTITSTDSKGRTLTKTIASDMTTSTTVLKSVEGSKVAELVKTFNSSGSLINTTVSYM